jgi:hypothetical protein
MNSAIAIIVLVTFFPMQIYAGSFDGFATDTQYERFFPRGPDAPAVPSYQNKLLDEPSKGVPAENSRTNWWLWGGLGLAAVLGCVVVLAAGGSKSGSSSGGTTTTTVTGSW